MARFFGEIGYGEPVEQSPGVWDIQVTEYQYQGDVIRNTRQLEDGEKVNDNVIVQNSISVVADEFAFKHFSKIQYVRWAGTLWTVSSVEVRSPRLILSLGRVYNGPTP